jgi:hypothetical protein
MSMQKKIKVGIDRKEDFYTTEISLFLMPEAVETNGDCMRRFGSGKLF